MEAEVIEMFCENCKLRIDNALAIQANTLPICKNCSREDIMVYILQKDLEKKEMGKKMTAKEKYIITIFNEDETINKSLSCDDVQFASGTIVVYRKSQILVFTERWKSFHICENRCE